MAGKRSLPIAGQKPAPPPGTVDPPEDPADRPPWHWSFIGIGFVFILWLPLAAVGNGIAAHVIEGADANRSQNTLFAVGLGCFVVATAIGGLLVGRFGGRAGIRQAIAAGLGAPALAWLLTAVSTGFLIALPALPPLLAVGAIAAYGGGKWGLHLRKQR